ncbi:MAG: FecR domain-containing protein [Elusimicrobia bacterium]|nr:FecR domain-containing protein [Elusimicrobiota bacterium]
MKKAVITIFSILTVSAVLRAGDNAVEDGIKGPSDGQIAAVKRVKGIAVLYDRETGSWEDISEKDMLAEGSRISTADDSELALEIEGKTVSLNGPSLLVLENMTAQASFELYYGKLRARIDKMTGGQSFSIRTPAAECSVKGTDFAVEVKGRDYRTGVRTYSGKVSVRNLRTGEEFELPEGYECELDRNSEKSDIYKIKEVEEEAAQESSGEPAEGMIKESTGRTSGKGRGTGERVPVGIEFNGSLGADVLMDPDNPEDKKIYYNLSLLPEIILWKFGIGLDMNVYFDEEGNVRTEDWDGWDDLAAKIWYIRYGQKDDPLYALVGGIRSHGIGHGLILNNYTNMLNYPDVRNKGFILNADLGGGMGFESIVSNIDSYPVTGGRFFFRPLRSRQLPVISRLVLGVTGVIDNDPDMFGGTDDDEVVFYGADCELPVVSKESLSTYLYYDYATYELGDAYGDKGSPGEGNALGVGGNAVRILRYRLEYRKLDNNFIPVYFDAFYEVERKTKPFLIGDSVTPTLEGPFGMLGLDIMSRLGIVLTYEDYNMDPGERYPYLHGSLLIDPAILLDRVEIDVSYDKKNVDNFSEIGKLEGAIMTTRVGYMIAPSIMLAVTHKQTFDEKGDSARTISMHTMFRF